MLFLTNKVVLKNKESGLVYNNVSHFIKKYESDCCICLQFPRDSVLTDCNHVFCRSCLLEMVEFSKKCPICSVLFKNVFTVKLILLVDIQDYIWFKRVDVCDSAEYFTFPYLSVYYIDSHRFKPTKLIYQSRDGQPYFLSEKTVSKIKKSKAPDLIFGKIIRIKEVKNYYRHIVEKSLIYIVDVEV